MKMTLPRYVLMLALFLVVMAVGAIKEGPEFVSKMIGWGFLAQMLLILNMLLARSEDE